MAIERSLGAAALADRWHIEDADLDQALGTRRTGPDAVDRITMRGDGANPYRY